jgi:hypothetical protein
VSEDQSKLLQYKSANNFSSKLLVALGSPQKQDIIMSGGRNKNFNDWPRGGSMFQPHVITHRANHIMESSPQNFFPNKMDDVRCGSVVLTRNQLLSEKKSATTRILN